MHEWLLFLCVFRVSLTLSEIVILVVGVPDIVKLALISRRPTHHSTHLQKLMVALAEITLLPPYFFSEDVRIDGFFEFAFLLVDFSYCSQSFVEGQPLFINFFGVGVVEELAPKGWVVFHLNQSLSNIMSNREQTKKLWQQIGLDKSPLSQSICQTDKKDRAVESEVLSCRGLDSVHAPSFIDERILRGAEQTQRAQSFQEVQNQAERFHKMMQALDVEIQQIEETEAIEIIEDGSRIQAVINYSKLSEQQNGWLYNEQIISKLPESITPLVYSKNSKAVEQTTIRRHKFRLTLLRHKFSQARQLLDQIKRHVVDCFQQTKKMQEKFKQDLTSCCTEFQRQYSIKLQESLFHHKQEYEQVKFELEMARAREEIKRVPVESELVLQEPETSILATEVDDTKKMQQLIHQNIQIRNKLATLQVERDKLLNEATEFKKKIAGIQSTTAAVRDSNDKLYEYIFDLEQQITYQKEQIPKLTQAIRKEITENYDLQLRQLEEQKMHLQSQEEELSQRVNRMTEEKLELSARLEGVQKELTELKITLANKNEEVERLEQLCLQNSEEIGALNMKIEQKENHFAQMLRQKDQKLSESAQSLKKIKIETPISSRGFQDIEYTRNQHKAATSKEHISSKDSDERYRVQNLEMQKLALLQENNSLKAALEVFSKSYTPPLQNYQPILSPRQHTTYSIENHYLSTKDYTPQPPQSDTSLQLKQRQLIKYQNYLEAQTRKLKEKQRQLDADYAIKQSLQKKQRESAQYPSRSYKHFSNQDDYGMKNIATAFPKNCPLVQPRKDQFCSSEAQAIIEKVKTRQRHRDVSCHSRCQNLGNCRCDVLSRGSRGSNQSASRDYYRTQPYRRSPSRRLQDYYRNEERSSKMKLIEDKVKRLKSQLKTSLSSMKNQ